MSEPILVFNRSVEQRRTPLAQRCGWRHSETF